MSSRTSTETSPQITVGFRTRSISDERLRFIRQVGATDVYLDHSSLDEEPDEFIDNTGENDTLVIDEDVIPSAEELIEAKERVEAHGLRLAGVHSLPHSIYGPIMLGTERADERIELIAQLIRNIGEAGIPILGYQWNPRGLVPMRTRPDRPIRGGAEATEFDLTDLEDPFEVAETVDREYSEAEFWENYERFVEAVVPVAEEADVRLALHPVDPPGIEQLGGIPRLFRNVENFERAMDIVPSYHHGLKLCLGCFSQLGEDIPALIRRFGERDQIVFVHFRDVEGTVPSFHETFVDEGNFDEFEAMEALVDIGFSGSVLPDHVPKIEGDSQWRHRANAFTAGYLKGVINSTLRARSGTLRET
ncbi:MULTISPECIES: mannonate dehydratase [Haloferacaceae]|uniref:mannonate dehydratase n=1 Tax=Halorubrum glutamatedens TaxID=2707018 RepID=A0ABD5QR09_9EURY|nr:mannonate dehydratase [Halobellus captivus]